MKRRHNLLLIALLGLSSAAMAATPSVLAPEKELEGVIQELDFGSNSMIFQGTRYRIAPDVEVEIRGSHGAFTLLQEGMKASVGYRVISASEREVFRIVQLPDNFDLDGA